MRSLVFGGGHARRELASARRRLGRKYCTRAPYTAGQLGTMSTSSDTRAASAHIERSATPQGLGRSLRALRKERGLSLQDVATATNVSASFLSLVENEKSDITIGRLVRLVRVLRRHARRARPGSGEGRGDRGRPGRRAPVPPLARRGDRHLHARARHRPRDDADAARVRARRRARRVRPPPRGRGVGVRDRGTALPQSRRLAAPLSRDGRERLLLGGAPASLLERRRRGGCGSSASTRPRCSSRLSRHGPAESVDAHPAERSLRET